MTDTFLIMGYRYETWHLCATIWILNRIIAL